MAKVVGESTYQKRLEALRETKRRHTREKQELLGSMDNDDHGRILPPPDAIEVVETLGSSGNIIRDARLKTFKVKSNHPSGGFFGPKACGENFRSFLDSHPVYIDPMSSLAGGYMAYFMSCRNPHWKPEFDYSHLYEEQKKYGIASGIGAVQHFCQDLTIGFSLGWGGLLEKVRHCRKVNAPESSGFYDGLEDVILGIQDWIRRHAEAARQMAEAEGNPQLRENLETMADINERLVTDPPRTFREACQWIVWFQMIARMYNGSGSMGQLDEVLRPCYERDVAANILTDEEAIFHLACLLLNDTQYVQLGGPDATGKDVTSRVSFLILEAVHRLKTPANMGIFVHQGLDPNLLRRGIEILFEDRTAFPKFLGEPVTEGFIKNGYPVELARQRVYSGCHWFAIPAREYTLNDCVKINFASVFDVALREMMADPGVIPSVEELWRRFENHLRRAVEVTAQGLDFHLEHMHEVFPELVLDLFSYGPIEKGLDASHGGGVEYYNMCIDGAALATAADSFAALEQRVEKERLLMWRELLQHLDNDFAGAEDVRLMLRNIPRFGRGGSRADEWAVRIAETFTRLVKEKPTPAGFNLIPGLFSWSASISMGLEVGATPNGRHAHAPISHGANPDPGFIKGGSAPTAMAVAVASVQPGYGNTAPLQLDMDPNLARGEDGLAKIEALIRGHFALGGTMINMNVVNKQQILEAHKDPSKYPDLIVRVTGYSAYFASLSKELRQFFVDRIVAEEE